jgi:hypothetical protein
MAAKDRRADTSISSSIAINSLFRATRTFLASCIADYNQSMRFRLRTLLIFLALAPPVIAIYVTAMLAARNVARDRASLEAERAAFEAERAAQPSRRGTP